ncbi:AAA family ATPase [Sulfurimonas indica]|uniref:AAA family ATPase n=1 Tax=Sulfurimonas indica TaxID=2508707 RepID=UPI0012640EF9|nr:AAA family ATPase [Sulfurimonas indica]
MKLTFYTRDRGFRIPKSSNLSVYLIKDNWNDFSFRTLYQITLFDDKGTEYDLGYIKIANFGQTTEERLELPTEFEELDQRFFSLGQSSEYYVTIQKLNPQLKELFLTNIRDIVFDKELQLKALEEEVTRTSLLRDTSIVTVKEQYFRILNGDAILTPYNFKYKTRQSNTEAGYKLTFNVEPKSNPPTNIHILIGRNGVGKTHLLNNMVKSFLQLDESKGSFQQIKDEWEDSGEFFSRVVSVSYSAFDPFQPYSEKEYPNYSYIGLKKTDENTTKNHAELAEEFSNSIEHCFRTGKKDKWLNAMQSLESSTLFNEINIAHIAEESVKAKNIKKIFKRLSSGHSIVLLTLTKLVEKVEEKTLVLLDEPEAHLHPPLLSAFIRSLSDLLVNRNAVGIIATHSPVIVQEVPKSCVWKLSRFRYEAKAERFEHETFGETIGKITREVFDLEVNESGFYKLLSDDVNDGKTYEQIVQKYNGQLGFEAKLLLRALLNNKIES